MADGVFDKLLEVISKSDKIGFGLLFASVGVFAAAHQWPTHFKLLPNDTLGWVFFAGLLGAGILIWSISACASRMLSKGWGRFKSWRRYRTTPSRTNELLPDETNGLVWALVNSDRRIMGNIYKPPLDGLVRKGFFLITDGMSRNQVLILNPRVEKRASKILAPYAESLHLVKDKKPPWDPGGTGRI